MANLIRGLSENGGVVFCGVDSTELDRGYEQIEYKLRALGADIERVVD